MKLVILERDGTINDDSHGYVTTPEEWTPLPGALDAIARLTHAGFRVVIASNQPGLGRGLFDVVSLNAIHAKMHKMLAAVGARVDAVFFCPHTPEDNCLCRKPRPGLFEQIGERYGADRQGVVVCGDNADHLVAGAAAGFEPHRVLTGKSAGWAGGASPDALSGAPSDAFPRGTQVHDDLGAFADALIARPAS